MTNYCNPSLSYFSFPVFVLYVISASPFQTIFIATLSIYITLQLLHKFSNIRKPEEGWYGQPKYCYKKTIHVVLNQLCSSLWTSLSRLYILADLISFLEIQRLQLAGSSSTVFAVNLILFFFFFTSDQFVKKQDFYIKSNFFTKNIFL